MLGYVIVGALAAFGLLSGIWTVWGLLLQGDRWGLRRCRYLRKMGVLEFTLAVPEREIDRWLIRDPQGVGLGANEHGAGTGDPPGCHQCGGVSEL